MSNEQAIKYIEYMRGEWAEKNSPCLDALTKGIEALKKVDNVQPILGGKVASAEKDGAE
jgi:hypothetical protein